MTKEEYDKPCKPIIEVIADLRRRHEDELRPWFERLNALSAVYVPVLSVSRAHWEELQMRQGIRSGFVRDRCRCGLEFEDPKELAHECPPGFRADGSAKP